MPKFINQGLKQPASGASGAVADDCQRPTPPADPDRTPLEGPEVRHESATAVPPTPPAAPGLIQIDQGQVRAHLDEVVRGTVEQTLNTLLEEEADRLCRAQRYERSPDRANTRAGHYPRKLMTKAGEVQLQVPKLRTLSLETAIIERYRRRESSVEEALVEMYLPNPILRPASIAVVDAPSLVITFGQVSHCAPLLRIQLMLLSVALMILPLAAAASGG